MRCCVLLCKNDSRQSSKAQGITFHTFPTEPSHRDAWLRAISRPTWSPKDRSAVCSDHFLKDDLYVTKNGLRKVRAGAVPFVEQVSPTSCMFGNPGEVGACRMCLVSGIKLFSIKLYNLGQAFERVTGLSVSEDDGLPQALCSECSRRLLNADLLRSKALRAYEIMVDLLNKQNSLTKESLKSIDRSYHCLISPLQSTLNPPYEFIYTRSENQEKSSNQENLEFDIVIKDESKFSNEIEENKSEINDEKVDVNDKSNGVFIDKSVEIFIDKSEEIFIDKSEEIFVDKSDEIFVDKSNKIFIDETKDFSDEIAAEDDENDQDFVANDDFDSEDSLPLERSRKKNKKEKVETKKRKAAKEKTQAQKKVRKKIENPPAEPKIDRRRKPFLNQDLNETLFTIVNLTFEEQIAEIEKRQESDNYKHSVYKCTECFKGFLDREAFNGHILRHTTECGEHKCEICKTYFKQSHALRKHITAHHTQRFTCNQCPYVTTHRQTARLHERWHNGTRYKCPHCPEDFGKFTTYMGHVRIKHPSDFVCALCGYSFVSQKGIDLHKKLKHREQEVVPPDGPNCDTCNVRFISRRAYTKHLNVSARHSPIACETNKATRQTRSKAPKLGGEQDNSEERSSCPSQPRKVEGPIPCEQCGLQLEDSRAYHTHFRRVHPDKNRTKYPSMKSPCMCELCGRIFQSYALLKDHTWVHTGEKPFKCAECGKAFRMKQRLVAHRRVHALVKASYVCSVCGKHFSTHSNRQRHMFIHTGLKPFKCEMCGKGFKHAAEKRAHVTYVHLKKPWPKRSRGKRQERQGSPQDIAIDIQPVWPACEPKLSDINILDDKPVYYNLKI